MDALWLCEETGAPVARDVCLACARYRQRPACPFPPALLRALAQSMAGETALTEAQASAQDAGAVLLRVTSLLGCTRQAWYALHRAPPLESPGRLWARLRGSIFHAAVESLAGAREVAEVRLVTSLADAGVQVWVAGKVDHYDPDTGILMDYKSINSYGRKLARLGLPKQHHIAQLWIYGWLLARAGYPYPTAGRLVYMDMGAVHGCDVAMPDPEMQAQVVQRILVKTRAITEVGTQGPVGDPTHAWECRYCAYSDQCPSCLKGAGRASPATTGQTYRDHACTV